MPASTSDDLLGGSDDLLGGSDDLLGGSGGIDGLPPPSRLIVRSVGQAGFASVFQKWAEELDWNPGVDDPRVIPLADPSGLFVGYLPRQSLPESILLPDERGEDGDAEIPVACIAAIRHDERNGFIAFFIVRNKQLRNAGYGWQISRTALQYLGAERNICLDGVEHQQGSYVRAGFTKVWDTCRFKLTLDGQDAAPAREENADDLVTVREGLALSVDGPATVAKIGDGTGPLVSLAAVSAFVERHSGFARRQEFMAGWLSSTEIDSVALVESSSGEIVAFGSVRTAVVGYSIGPVFAADPETATHVLAAIVAGVRRREKLSPWSSRQEQPQEIHLHADVCMANPSARGVFERFGFFDSKSLVCGPHVTKGNPTY
ncbi:hypothetical protein DFJ73DRAFT_801298 [Zopfochytrium polystomum]|nr:hypothetical protein DFJ73DRAFT_801298 [Zopfochytrium polystomum]